MTHDIVHDIARDVAQDVARAPMDRPVAVAAKRTAVLMATAVCAAIGIGCKDTAPVSTGVDASQAFWQLSTNIEALTLDSGQTQQIVAVSLNYRGDTLTTLPAPAYQSLDTSKVTVTPDGLITAIKPSTSSVLVIASLTVDGVTNADTTTVLVSRGSHTFGSLSLRAKVPDSTQVGYGASKSLSVAATDGGGATLTGLAVKYQSLDPIIATVRGTQVYATTKGVARIVATSTSYGVTHADTTHIVVTNPMTQTYTFNSPTAVTAGSAPLVSSGYGLIGAGGTVTWTNLGITPSTSVTFLDGADSLALPVTGALNAAGGNITTLVPYVSQSRMFTKPGRIRFKDAAGDTASFLVIPND